jgi:surface antigen
MSQYNAPTRATKPARNKNSMGPFTKADRCYYGRVCYWIVQTRLEARYFQDQGDIEDAMHAAERIANGKKALLLGYYDTGHGHGMSIVPRNRESW